MSRKPTYSQASNVHSKTDDSLTTLKAPQYGGPFRQQYEAGAGAEQGSFKGKHPRYPDYWYPDDRERDTYYQIKRQLPNDFGLKYASDKDVQYVIDKRNAKDLATFKKFVEDSIPRGTPWAKEYFEKIMPGWYQSKIDIINDKMGICNRFIDITVRGPQSIEDMYLLFMLYSGKIMFPRNWDELINGLPVARQDFTHGLFNPSRWVDSQYVLSARNQKYLANFAIPGIDIKGLAARELVDTEANLAGDDDAGHNYNQAGTYQITPDDVEPAVAGAPYAGGGTLWARHGAGVINQGFGGANMLGGRGLIRPDVATRINRPV
jgi:hypothetical protein